MSTKVDVVAIKSERSRIYSEIANPVAPNPIEFPLVWVPMMILVDAIAFVCKFWEPHLVCPGGSIDEAFANPDIGFVAVR